MEKYVHLHISASLGDRGCQHVNASLEGEGGQHFFRGRGILLFYFQYKHTVESIIIIQSNN